MSYKTETIRKGFLLSAEKDRVFASVKQSYAMTIAQVWLTLLVLAVLFMFFVKESDSFLPAYRVTILIYITIHL